MDQTSENNSGTAPSEFRILIVNGEDFLRWLYVDLFSKQGFTVEEADNGLYALRMAKSKRYDLILSNLSLPKMHGIDVLKNLKQDKADYGKFVFIASYSQIVIIEQAFKAGVDGYIEASRYSPQQILDYCFQQGYLPSQLSREPTEAARKDVSKWIQGVDHDKKQLPIGAIVGLVIVTAVLVILSSPMNWDEFGIWMFKFLIVGSLAFEIGKDYVK